MKKDYGKSKIIDKNIEEKNHAIRDYSMAWFFSYSDFSYLIISCIV
ncbi:hypothetical protein [Clostridium sp. OS1-26]|nr:hypothetical protein [Clostridium sp. OS1-26]WML34579.1 hypothetical protein RCG18_25440 [Clostridium sp. OS1-26]